MRTCCSGNVHRPCLFVLISGLVCFSFGVLQLSHLLCSLNPWLLHHRATALGAETAKRCHQTPLVCQGEQTQAANPVPHEGNQRLIVSTCQEENTLNETYVLKNYYIQHPGARGVQPAQPSSPAPAFPHPQNPAVLLWHPAARTQQASMDSAFDCTG